MTKFTVAVVVALVLTVICIQESSAVPITEVQEVKVLLKGDTPVAEDKEASENSETMLDIKTKHDFECRFCCNCCNKENFCGLCCRF